MRLPLLLVSRIRRIAFLSLWPRQTSSIVLLTAEEPDENSAINEDNVAEEVLDIDDMEGEDDEIALDEMDEVGDGSEA